MIQSNLPEPKLNFRYLVNEMAKLMTEDGMVSIRMMTEKDKDNLSEIAAILGGQNGEEAYRNMRDTILEVVIQKAALSNTPSKELATLLLYVLSPMPEVSVLEKAAFFPASGEEMERSQTQRGSLPERYPDFDFVEATNRWLAHHKTPSESTIYQNPLFLLMARNMEEWADNLNSLDKILGRHKNCNLPLYRAQQMLSFALVSVQRYLAVRAAQAGDGRIPERDADIFRNGLDKIYNGALGAQWMAIPLSNGGIRNGAAVGFRQSVSEVNPLVLRRRFAGGFFVDTETQKVETKRFVYLPAPTVLRNQSEYVSQSDRGIIEKGICRIPSHMGAAKKFSILIGKVDNTDKGGSPLSYPNTEQEALDAVSALYEGSRQAFKIHEGALAACGEYTEVLRGGMTEIAAAVSEYEDNSILSRIREGNPMPKADESFEWLDKDSEMEKFLQRAAAQVAYGVGSATSEVEQYKKGINTLRGLVANEDRVLSNEAFNDQTARFLLYSKLCSFFYETMDTEFSRRPQTEQKTLTDLRSVKHQLYSLTANNDVRYKLSHIVQYALTAPMLCPDNEMSRTWFFEKMGVGLTNMFAEPEEEPARVAFNKFKESVRFQEKMDVSVDEDDNIDNGVVSFS